MIWIWENLQIAKHIHWGVCSADRTDWCFVICRFSQVASYKYFIAILTLCTIFWCNMLQEVAGMERPRCSHRSLDSQQPGTLTWWDLHGKKSALYRAYLCHAKKRNVKVGIMSCEFAVSSKEDWIEAESFSGNYSFLWFSSQVRAVGNVAGIEGRGLSNSFAD